MKCPECGKDEAVEAHVDTFPCSECCSEQNVSYCICESCGFTFRLNNGVFLDGAKPSAGERRIARRLEEIMAEAVTDSILQNMSLSDYIKNLPSCIKCGSIAVVFDDGTFRCGMCDFEWELL